MSNVANFAITFDELRTIVAVQQGYGQDMSGWNANQLYVLNDVVRSGIAQVYFPPPVNGEKVAPDWTFLKPQSTLDLPSGQDQITLPIDFGSFVGPITVLNSASAPRLIQWTNEGKIRQMQQGFPTRTGPPLYACECPLRMNGAPQGQSKALLVYPIPDGEYTLECVYSINPD